MQGISFARALASALYPASSRSANASSRPGQMTAFDFEFISIEDTPLPLISFDGKVLLIVNTASFCGFTKQYQGLQALWSKYHDQGLVLIGVPSNDFGWQEPGSNDEIRVSCQGTFGVTFPLTSKNKVRGGDAHPFFSWAHRTYGTRHIPRWNFHKYLVGRDGHIAGAYSAITRPNSSRLARAIETELAKPYLEQTTEIQPVPMLVRKEPSSSVCWGNS